MINSSHSNKFRYFIFFFIILIFSYTTAFAAEDIWKKKESVDDQDVQIKYEQEITIKSPILSGDINKITMNIAEQKLDQSYQTVVGLFDPEENNFNLNMWVESDGEDIKNIIKRRS